MLFILRVWAYVQSFPSVAILWTAWCLVWLAVRAKWYKPTSRAFDMRGNVPVLTSLLALEASRAP